MDPESGDWDDIDQELEELEGEPEEPAAPERRSTVIDGALEATAEASAHGDDELASADDFADEGDLASADDLAAADEPASHASDPSEPLLPAMVEEVLEDSGFKPDHANYESTREGVAAFISQSLLTESYTVSRAAVDIMIADIEERLNAQINAILHNEDFQHLESMWRGLKFVIDRVNFDENVKVEFTNINKEDLEEDLEDAPTLTKSGFFSLAYSAEFGQFGGEPYGVIAGNFEFDAGGRDLALLKNLASIAAMAHAPLITNVGPSFFGFHDFEAVTQLRDMKTLMDAPQYAKWQAFREIPDASYVGLCMPRFLGREPYRESTHPIRTFNFTEEVRGLDDHLWVGANLAMITRVADSFAKYRWCPNIIGPQSGGAVDQLPLTDYRSLEGIQAKIPTEIMLTEKREFELAEEGIIGLTFRKDSDSVCFFSANSCQKPKHFGNSIEAKALEVNYRLGTQLPYMFVISRLAHFIKVMQREQLGGYKTRVDLERELNKWLGNYVADMENPNIRVRAARPLRRAFIKVEEVEGQAGWFACKVEVQPHMKYMGASFTLSLLGRLDK